MPCKVCSIDVVHSIAIFVFRPVPVLLGHARPPRSLNDRLKSCLH